MPTLAGQRAQFTWSLNQYNLAEDAEKKAFFARNMAKYIAAAPANGFTIEQLSQGQSYPAEVNQYLADLSELDQTPGISEGQAIQQIAGTVDTSDALKIGSGGRVVYAYGYECAPDRLKIGLTEGDTVQRIAAQIGTSTPDKPVLKLEIRTHDCSSLERAIHAILKYRGRKIEGGGAEWFKVTREEIVEIYEAVSAQLVAEPNLSATA
jgi:T5orf172 domain